MRMLFLPFPDGPHSCSVGPRSRCPFWVGPLTSVFPSLVLYSQMHLYLNVPTPRCPTGTSHSPGYSPCLAMSPCISFPSLLHVGE